MKEKIIEILENVKWGNVYVPEATQQVLNLFAVSGQSKQLCDFLDWMRKNLSVSIQYENDYIIENYKKSHN